ncbi:fasciclin domain-containing protein [Methanoculleus oceani]|uniref:Fasciclin n=1 Tax=Methanoculleus oceani TaxID=2184756 RepID=A0ABD4TD27_9EURY|nr:fasciclin domain-containing protein [Methanoculleus sp. CWC-02]MCM2466205.1 fasciclin [Methanoculleus sp. CWC-02]
MRANCALFITALVIGAAVLICGCTAPSGDETRNQTDGTPAGTPVDESLTIGEVLARDGNFSTLIQAFEAAGLKGTLAGPGPYTLFAPTDEAFGRLPDTVMEELFNDPKGNLAEILLYHMAPGTYMASGIATNDTIATVQGSPIAVDAAGETVTVNGAEVVRADMVAANGIIHAIDAVMLPPDITLTAMNDTADMTTQTGNTTNVTG